MNGSVNKDILVGNLGKNPEIRKLESGALMARFSMATSEYYTDKTSGKKIESTDWHDVVVWRNLAETTEKYLKKGMKGNAVQELQMRGAPHLALTDTSRPCRGFPECFRSLGAHR